jgi:NitT/TauT family transport system substrate-binding protein
MAMGLLAVLLAQGSPADAQERAEFNLSRQPGLTYLPNQLMEDQKLIEKHAEKLGLKDLKVNYLTFTSGGVSTDTLLAGQVDIVTSGYSNMLLIWAKTNGGVKALAGVGGSPLTLLTRNPDIKSIKDFKPTDRIAVPTLRQSMQSTILGIALDKEYGPGSHAKLDDIQVQIGHPEATQALLNKTHEINTHFSIPPFADTAMRSSDPKVHVVLESIDVLGGPAHIVCAYASSKFVDANPIKTKAFLAALDEANEMIAKDPKAAIAGYIRVTKDKGAPEDLLSVVTRKGSLYTSTPTRTMLYAEQMTKTGLLKVKPASWKDYHFPVIHDRPGS